MKKSLLLVLFAFFTLSGFSQKSGYTVHLDLTQVENDQLQILLEVPAVEAETIEFQMPKIVPGTYGISDFGRFVSNLTALDSSGNELPIKQQSVNRWLISKAQSLESLTYKVDDTFDGDAGRTVFEPGGSNIQTDTNFVLNLFAMVGFLEGMNDLPYEVRIMYPEHLYATTALEPIERTTSFDHFKAKDYFTLHDSPIMYSAPDTASLQVANALIEVAVYSPGKQISAQEVMDRNADLFQAAADYLGGELPVERYAQLIYLWEGPTNSGGVGALEHSFSTVFSMPDLPDSIMGQEIRDVTAHEFFHIVTPLTIHSEEIHNYNWIEPEMSEHLWLYEGVTEYSAHHMQVKAGLISQDEFLATMRGKMTSNSNNYDDQVPFTTMSAHCLDVYAGEYGNVYQKGALIGMCLDLALLDWSEGNYGLQSLISDLQDRYGAERAFKDDELFDVIAEMTFPEIRDFFTYHLESYKSLPYAEMLEKAGITYEAAVPSSEITFGRVSLGYNPAEGRLTVQNISSANQFAQDLGYQNGDELVSINGYDLTDFQTISSNIDLWRQETKPGDKVRVTVLRKNDKDEYESVILKGKAMEVETSDDHVLSWAEEPTDEQLTIRNAWLTKAQ